MTEIGVDPLATLIVRDLMTTEVIAVAPTTTLHEAIGIMVRRSVRHLPVVENGEVVGVLSDRNIRVVLTEDEDFVRRREYLATTTAADRASHPVTTVNPDAPVQQAARIFVESRIGCLPVVDAEGRIQGILTQTDLLKWFARLAD
jgi:acetoin utilization protein AcuB